MGRMNYHVVSVNWFRSLYVAQQKHGKIEVFEQFGALYIHKLNDKHLQPDQMSYWQDLLRLTILQTLPRKQDSCTYVWLMLAQRCRRCTLLQLLLYLLINITYI